MSGFAIRMSAYKTVNKRADPKRNFAASLARSGYTASRKRAQREKKGEEREVEAWLSEERRAGEAD